MARRKRPRGLGWLYPPQPCGRNYEQFNSGATYRAGYEALAYRKHGPNEQTFTPTPKRVVSMMSKMKHEMFEQYERDCEELSSSTEIDYRAEYAKCSRVCSTKTNPCGKTCVTKKKTCHRPPADGICSVDRFQMKLPIEETIAQAEAGGGDTSFDPAEFAPSKPEPVEPPGGWFGLGRWRGRSRIRTARTVKVARKRAA